jgi:hypothetical protein
LLFLSLSITSLMLRFPSILVHYSFSFYIPKTLIHTMFNISRLLPPHLIQLFQSPL